MGDGGFMDVMSRREIMGKVLAGMASGARFVKGTYTIPDNGSFVINFGKTFSKYLFYIEMTDESKAALIDTGKTSSRTFAAFGVYPEMEIGNVIGNSNLGSRITPSSKALSEGHFSATKSSNSIELPTGGTGNSNVFYWGYTYNYYIVEIK